jgi:hypothetical protein
LVAGLAIILALVPPPAVAQQAVEQCVAIAEDEARLACYDAIFLTTGTTGAEAVVAESERLIPARPSGRRPATLSVSCAEGRVVVAFGFAGQLVSNTGDIAPLTYQVDAGGATARTLRADPDNVQLSFDSPRDVEAFLDSLIGGNNLKIRMTPVRQRSVTVDFRLPPIADEIEALRARCTPS